MKIRCVVSCRNANGTPDFYPCLVECTPDEREQGEHYDRAKEMAKEAGHEGFGLVYDEDDGPQWLFDQLFRSTGPAPKPGAVVPPFTVSEGKKLVVVTLAALTRLQWAGGVLVPADFDVAEYEEDVVDAAYDKVDGGDYQDDPHFWDKGDCYVEGVLNAGDVTHQEVAYTAAVDEDGAVKLEPYEE